MARKTVASLSAEIDALRSALQSAIDSRDAEIARLDREIRKNREQLNTYDELLSDIDSLRQSEAAPELPDSPAQRARACAAAAGYSPDQLAKAIAIRNKCCTRVTNGIVYTKNSNGWFPANPLQIQGAITNS